MNTYFSHGFTRFQKTFHKVAGWASKHPKISWPIAILLGSIIIFTTLSYGVARWYQHSQAGKPYNIGVTFIAPYATYLGQDPQETMSALTDELGLRQFRLVSYWSQHEKVQGQYDFSELDWQFAQAEKTGSTVSLAIGLRQPRWPECHAPSFYDTKQPREQWQPALEKYMTAVVQRYKKLTST